MEIADMDMLIAVGFGSACVVKDGDLFYDGEREWRQGREPKTLAQIEDSAKQEPDADWKVVLHGPLSGATYQRQGDAKWVLTDSNQGFA